MADSGIRHRLGLLSVRRLRPVLGLFGVRLNLYSRSFNAVYDRMIGFDLDRVFSIIRDGDFDCIIASDTSFACRTICEQLGIPMISSCTGARADHGNAQLFADRATGEGGVGGDDAVEISVADDREDPIEVEADHAIVDGVERT